LLKLETPPRRRKVAATPQAKISFPLRIKKSARAKTKKCKENFAFGVLLFQSRRRRVLDYARAGREEKGVWGK